MRDKSPLRAETWPMSRTCPFSPPPEYAGLREHPGLLRLTGPSGRTVFVAARHEDVRAVLGDARFSSDRSHPDFPWTRVGETVFPGFRPSLIEMDPPEHGPARRAVAGEFTIRRIREMCPKVQRVVDGPLDDVLAAAGPDPGGGGGTAEVLLHRPAVPDSPRHGGRRDRRHSDTGG
ncbi:hypothetical protein M1P56_18140 [Streptomyces sp. HU2014]|uniref:hypothetical protein n=1 Tax=Streptomyces sp. HU2014 TaxID=2939414 RepID=UPI00200F3E06|nr:hypothetical protein [Streptomyces sp. HU2014]UQI49638.1 hypothetical protein M1P56_18140 [Streptomyces sp. HU2014]